MFITCSSFFLLIYPWHGFGPFKPRSEKHFISCLNLENDSSADIYENFRGTCQQLPSGARDTVGGRMPHDNELMKRLF